MSEHETIDLYYWPTPNGWKITIALEEMRIPYQVKLINIGKGEQFDPAFLKIAPNNRMPAIHDPTGPEGTPVTLFESGAILLYLAEKSGQFAGSTAQNRREVLQWLMWQMGGVGPMAGQAHHFLKYAPKMDPPNDIPYAKERYRREVARLYQVLDRQLAGRDFVCGALSIADFAIWPWAHLWEGQQQDLGDKPNLARWLDRCAERPGFSAGKAVALDLRSDNSSKDAQNVLFKR